MVWKGFAPKCCFAQTRRQSCEHPRVALQNTNVNINDITTKRTNKDFTPKKGWTHIILGLKEEREPVHKEKKRRGRKTLFTSKFGFIHKSKTPRHQKAAKRTRLHRGSSAGEVHHSRKRHYVPKKKNKKKTIGALGGQKDEGRKKQGPFQCLENLMFYQKDNSLKKEGGLDLGQDCFPQGSKMALVGRKKNDGNHTHILQVDKDKL